MQQLLVYDRKFMPKSAFQLLYCVWAIPVQIFLEVSLIRRNPGPSGPVTVEAMG
jgi:hypothetical protein